MAAPLVQLNRRDPESALAFDDGHDFFVATSGDSFAANMLRGMLVKLAIVALLASLALLMTTIGNAGIALLACLALYFAGNGLVYVRAGIRAVKDNLPLTRLLEAMERIVPDLQRFNIDARLATSQVVSWQVVVDAWLYYGVYMIIFLIAGWLFLRRSELAERAFEPHHYRRRADGGSADCGGAGVSAAPIGEFSRWCG